MRNICLLIIGALCFASCGPSDPQKVCKSKESCMNDSECHCWCSIKNGFRKKIVTDTPMWASDDSNSRFCYCNQSDYDKSQENK